MSESFPTGQSCSQCHFWRGEPYKHGESESRICHRYPPKPMLYPSDNQHPIMYVPSDYMPQTEARSWCGEYKRLNSVPSFQTTHL